MAMTEMKPELPASPSQAPAPARRGVTLRALLIAFFLAPLNSLWIVHTEIIQYAGHPTTVSLFFNVIFCLAVLVLINAALARWAPRYRLSQGELLTIYILLSLSTAMCGHDLIQVLISVMANPAWFAQQTPENHWGDFLKDIPDWLVVKNTDVLKDYFNGTNRWNGFYHKEYILAWLPPAAIWTGFFMILIFTMLCLSVILRKQWTERERLTFPIIELPLRMTDESFSLFRNRLFWIAVAIAGGVDLINTLHLNIPTVPGLPTRDMALNTWINDMPWRAIGWTPLQIIPFVVGIGFLLPVDLAFSCWFFYWYWKAQYVVTAYWGLNDGRPTFPYIVEQSSGAYLGVCVLVIWLARDYLKQVFLTAMGKKSAVSDADEPISYRLALFGVIAGLVAAGLFAHAGGLRWTLVPVFILMYFALAIAISRMRAEMGTPAHDLHYGGPDQIIPRLMGIDTFSNDRQSLIWFSLSWGYNRAYRSHPMPHHLEGFRLAHLARMDSRRLFWAMLFFGFWGCVCAFWALLQVYYQIGAGTAKVVGPATYFGNEAWNRMSQWVQSPTPAEPLSKYFALGGLAFSLFLTAMRARYTWWMFHPVGLAVSSSWAMGYMWFPLFIAWLCKVCVLRAGGLPMYRKAMPFFLGLIFGEFVVGMALNLIGLIFHLQIYRLWG